MLTVAAGVGAAVAMAALSPILSGRSVAGRRPSSPR
jgi:hypothetical protein